jgi:hypothetical protein
MCALALFVDERLPLAHAQGIAALELSARAAACVDDAWSGMSILAPPEGFVSVLDTTLEIQATFPGCLAIPGVWASVVVRYMGKSTKRVDHLTLVLKVQCEFVSERCKGTKNDILQVTLR